MKRKFFLKRLATYFFTMLIPMLLLFLVFFAMNYSGVNDDLRDQGKQTLNAVDVNFDLVLSNVLYQNDLLTSTTRMNLSLRRILEGSQMTYSDATHMSSLKAILSSIQDAHEYVESIYIYLEETDRFFSSDQGVRMISDREDAGWIGFYEDMGEDRDTFIASRQISQGTAQDLAVLSVYKRLLLQKGCIVVNLNLNRFQEMIGKQISDREETVYLLNQDGAVLARQSYEGAEQMDESFFREGQEQQGTAWTEYLAGFDGTWVKQESGRFLFSVGSYEPMNVYYVSVISSRARTEGIIALMRFFLLFLSIDLGVVVVLAYLTTKRSFDQISYMIHVFDEAEKGLPVEKPQERNRDEYDVIMNNIIYLYLNTNYLNTELKENQYKREHAEMMSLQLQINPHFLFNTLQTVDMEIRKEKTPKEEISHLVRSVSDILKYALGDPGEDVTVKEELEHLKKYIAIQKFRFGDRFIIYYEAEEEVLDAEVFRLFLQPLVENSLIHGIRPLERRGYIKVSIQRKDHQLRCCVVDTGIGMDRERLEELQLRIRSEQVQGIGLINLHRRLVLRCGEASGLTIRSKAGYGTAVSFRLPYRRA